MTTLLDIRCLGLDSVFVLISTNSISESLSSLSFFGRNWDLLTAILGFLLNDLKCTNHWNINEFKVIERDVPYI